MALTSHSEVSFLVLVQIPCLPDPVLALIDSGATSNFLDSSLADSPLFVMEPLDHPISLCLFDGKPATAGFIHESVTTSVAFIDGSTQNLSLLVTNSTHWLQWSSACHGYEVPIRQSIGPHCLYFQNGPPI